MKKIMYFATALLVLVGCNKKSQEAKENAPAQIVTITGRVDFSSQNGPKKVVAKGDWVNAEIDSEIQFEWEAGDEIAIMSEDMQEIQKFTITSISEDGQTAEFTGEPLSGGMNEYMVVYPYVCGYITYQAVISGGENFICWDQQYDGKLRPAGFGYGDNESFSISNFKPVFDLSLKGEVTLGKIRCYELDDDKFLYSELSFGTDGLALTSTACHVPFPSCVLGGDGLRFIFYDLEDNLIMTKSADYNFTEGTDNCILCFPEFEVVATPATTPTLADALVEGSTFELGFYAYDPDNEAQQGLYEFGYQKQGDGSFKCVKCIVVGIDMLEAAGEEVISAYYPVSKLPERNVIKYEFPSELGGDLYIELDADNNTYNISDDLENNFQCSFVKEGVDTYIKVNGVNILGNLSKPTPHK